MVAGGGDIAEYRRRFESDAPLGRDVLKLFTAASAVPIRVEPVRQNAPSHSWVLHVRLPAHLEEYFGFTRQILVYCPCREDLRTQDVKRVGTLIRATDGEVEQDVSMIICADPLVKDKLAEWALESSPGGVMIVPLSKERMEALLAGDDAHDALRTAIGEWISQRDHYDERRPVTGKGFHGRGGLLRDLERHLATNAGDLGIFGLRRIGKTSLVRELEERISKKQELLPVFIDLEGSVNGAHAAYRIGEELVVQLARYSSLTEREAQRALGIPETWADHDPQLLIASVADSLRAALSRGVLKEYRLIFILDEAESLLPTPQTPAEHAIQLFRSLRGISQETRRLNLVLVGVNATPAESPRLGDADNPLFGLLAVHYLGPLKPGECVEMLKKIGKRMQVRWEDAPARALSDYVGAHPLLARLAASDLVRQNPERPLRPTVTQVNETLERFYERRSDIFTQMIDSLERYYPMELEVLEVLAKGDQVFATELLDDDPSLVNHLHGYGVLDREHLSILNPAFRQWLRQIADSPTTDAN